MSAPPPKPLRPRHLKFVEGVLAGKSSTQAHPGAGYRATEPAARRNASRLLTNADVQSAIAAAREKAMQHLDVTAEAIVARLWEEANDHSVGATHSGRVRALELLGKIRGLFADPTLKVVGDPDRPVPHVVTGVVDVEHRPAPAAVVDFLRDLGLPCPDQLPPHGDAELVDC